MSDNNDHPYPPPTIVKWIQGEDFDMEELSNELQYWADWADEDAERVATLKEYIGEGLTPQRFEAIFRQTKGLTSHG